MKKFLMFVLAVAFLLAFAPLLFAADLGSPIPLDERVQKLEAEMIEVRAALGLTTPVPKPATNSDVDYASVVNRVAAGETVQIAIGETTAGYLTVAAATLPEGITPGLYSCFPSAIGPAMIAVGKSSPIPRSPTIYGGGIVFNSFANCPGGVCPRR